MKKFLLVLLLFPAIIFAQSKKKKRIAQENANKELILHLQSHIQYLADDKLEGRRTGTNGELLALQYITDQYRQIGLEPKGTDGFIQEFEINEGLQFDPATHLKVEGKALQLQQEYFPLAFSAAKTFKATPAIALSEKNEPWFTDLKDLLEENKTNPHFNIIEEIKKMANNVAAKGATALFLFNTASITDNVLFNKNDKSILLAVFPSVVNAIQL